MGVKGLNHYLCQSTVASREIVLEEFAKEYKKQHNRQPLLVFDGESFWHVLHGSLPRIFGGQFIQFRKKAEDVCKRLTQMGFRLSFVFGNSPISADAKAEERGKQTLLHLTSFYRQILKKKNTPQINEIWPPCLRNVFPYYLRSLPNITVLQSLMDKDLSIACYAKDNDAAAIVSNDSDMILFAVCPVMHARGLVTARRRVVLMYPSYFCEDIGLSVERLPLLSVYLGNQETPITTNVVEATDGVIQRKIKSGDRGNVQDVIEYIRNLEAPINLEDLTRDIFQEVDDENINAVRVSLGRYILRERDYEFDVPPMYKKIKNSPMIEPIISPGDSMTPEISRFLEKIKKSVIKCDIILKAKAWRREFNVMHMAWPIPGVGIDDPEGLYCPIFSAHAFLLGKKEHLMIVPRFESDPIKLAEPAFRKIYLETKPLSLPDGSPMPVAHELWISQDKKLQVTALISIWDASDLDFDTLMDLPPSSLCFILVLHWLRRKATMEDWEVFSFLATHVRMRHFSVDQLWRMDDMSISKSLTARSVVLGNVFSKLIGRFLWLVSLCGAPFKTVDLLPDLMFDGMVFQKKYEKARLRKDEAGVDFDELLESICSSKDVVIDSPKDRDRVNKLFCVLNGQSVSLPKFDNDDRARAIPRLSTALEHEPIWYTEWSSNNSLKPAQVFMRQSRRGGSLSQGRARSQRPPHRAMPNGVRPRRGGVFKQGGMRNKEKEHRYSSSGSSYKGSTSDCGYQSSNQGKQQTKQQPQKQTNKFDTMSNDLNQMTDDTGYNTFSPNNSSTEPQKTKHTAVAQQAKGNETDMLSFSDALSITKSTKMEKVPEQVMAPSPVTITTTAVTNTQQQQQQQQQPPLATSPNSLQFGNMMSLASDQDSDDGWSNEPKPDLPVQSAQRDSWGDVWEDVAQLSVTQTPKTERPVQSSQQQQRVQQTLHKSSKPSLPTGKEPSIFKEDVWEKVSDSAWSDVENDKKSSGRYASSWNQDDEWSVDVEKEKPTSVTRNDFSYAQAAGAVKLQEPKNNNNESWVQQMMANKNYQEFVPSSRPISRTASESAPSEIDDGQQYRANRYIHPGRRPMIMGYNPVPLQYAQRYQKRGPESADGNGEMNMQQGYHPQAIPMVMIPAMIPAPYLPHMNQNI